MSISGPYIGESRAGETERLQASRAGVRGWDRVSHKSGAALTHD